MDFFEILRLSALFGLGFVSVYMGMKSKILLNITSLINEADETFKNIEHSGIQKMELVVKRLRNMLPVWLRPFFPDSMIEQLVQTIFDECKKFAKESIDKVVDKIEEKIDENK